jgi:ribosomal protein S18 acetylase RimI-like enzyme
MAQGASVRRATAGDEARVVEALTRAFDTDEPFNWGLRQDSRRAEAFRLAFRTILRRYLGFGATYVVGDGAGSALWAGSDQWEVPVWRELLLLPTYLRCSSLSRFTRVTGTFDAMKAHHPREPHQYLFLLGVDPAHQGRGYGSELLKQVLDECDRDGRPAYLEATSAKNIGLYRRHGFETTVVFPCAGGGPPLTGMWRKPAGK